MIQFLFCKCHQLSQPLTLLQLAVTALKWNTGGKCFTWIYLYSFAWIYRSSILQLFLKRASKSQSLEQNKLQSRSLQQQEEKLTLENSRDLVTPYMFYHTKKPKPYFSLAPAPRAMIFTATFTSHIPFFPHELRFTSELGIGEHLLSHRYPCAVFQHFYIAAQSEVWGHKLTLTWTGKLSWQPNTERSHAVRTGTLPGASGDLSPALAPRSKGRPAFPEAARHFLQQLHLPWRARQRLNRETPDRKSVV